MLELRGLVWVKWRMAPLLSNGGGIATALACEATVAVYSDIVAPLSDDSVKKAQCDLCDSLQRSAKAEEDAGLSVAVAMQEQCKQRTSATTFTCLQLYFQARRSSRTNQRKGNGGCLPKVAVGACHETRTLVAGQVPIQVSPRHVQIAPS